MIRFISGKPGSGKSAYATKLIVAELISSDRFISTNVPLEFDVLQEYLHEEGHHIHVLDRIRLLTEAETFDFWRHRTPDETKDIVPPPLRRSKEGDLVPDVNAEDDFSHLGGDGFKSTCFFIDEIHLFFNSRQWKDTGKAALRYASQHRHLGDDVFCLTQSVKNVDSQFRSLAQDFTYLRNFRVEKFGMFAAPNKFQANTYLTPQSDGRKDPAVATQDFPLDKRLFGCYKTTGGVGMPGVKTADIGKKAKGVPLWLIWAGIPLVALTVFFGLRYGMFAATNKLLGSAPKTLVEAKTPDSKTPDAKTFDSKTSDFRPILYTVFTSSGKNSTWQLTDGRTIALADVQSYTSHSVTLKDGTVIYKQQLTQQNSSHENLGNQTRQSNSSLSSLQSQFPGGLSR